MKTKVKLLAITVLSSLLFASCDTKSTVAKPANDTPPIAIDVIAPEITKQLSGRFKERFVRVGDVKFSMTKPDEYSDPAHCYHVEIFYKQEDQEKRHVMELVKVIKAASPKLVTYECELPVTLFGEEPATDEHFDKYFRVTIDELMNDTQGNT